VAVVNLTGLARCRTVRFGRGYFAPLRVWYDIVACLVEPRSSHFVNRRYRETIRNYRLEELDTLEQNTIGFGQLILEDHLGERIDGRAIVDIDVRSQSI
jgi:hypothetical protein